MGTKVALLIIDAQNDFIEGGSLAVPGGFEAMERISAFIRTKGQHLHYIGLTLDSHHQHHIAHPAVWIDQNGKHPAPLTLIMKDDVVGQNPIYRASNPGWQADLENYLIELEKRNSVRKQFNLPEIIHTIWPPHCLIGTNGMSIVPSVMDSVLNWEVSKNRVAAKVTKGSFIFAEHFSVFKAEVPDDREPMTKVNWQLINSLSTHDTLIWTGLAEDYCLASSFYDFLIQLGGGDEQSMREIAKKMVFATDATAAVGAIPALSQNLHAFLDRFGVQKDTLANIL